jgi:hypothetical protein
MPKFNARMSTLQNIDAFGFTAVKQAGSELTREIYEGDRCVFVGTPWQIIGWLKMGAPRPERIEAEGFGEGEDGDDDQERVRIRKAR